MASAQGRTRDLSLRLGLAFGGILVGLAACAGSRPAAPTGPDASPDDAGPPASTGPLRVRLFSLETEWKHPSNPVAEQAMLARCTARGFEVTSTRDSAALVASLASTDVVVFLVTSGIVFDGPQRSAFEAWVRAGHGVVGVHSASYTDVDWPFMRELVGATFRGHPPVMEGTLTVDAPSVPIVAHLARPWVRTDEWYTFVYRPEDNPALELLLSLDETATRADYPGPGQPDWLRVGRHPLTWRQEYVGTRSFYTALGHTEASWTEEPFLVMLENAIRWAGRR